MFKRLTEGHFAAIFVAVIFLGLWVLTGAHPEIPISELTGQAVHHLAIYTAYWALLIVFLGGLGYRVIDALKPSPVAIAILVGAIVLGAALAVAH